MDITDDLERLSRLHKDGALSAEEFAQAKSKVLAAAERKGPLETANRYASLWVVMALIGVIVFLVILFTIILPRAHENNHRTFQIQLPP